MKPSDLTEEDRAAWLALIDERITQQAQAVAERAPGVILDTLKRAASAR